MNSDRAGFRAWRRRVTQFLISVLSFSEARASTKRGRNQLRIAAGVSAIAATGFSITKLIDPPATAFDIWFCFYAGGMLIMFRTAAWLFLTLEGGRE